MVELASVERCTGCMVCVEGCPQRAISIITDDRGFEQPCINLDRCVECGRCQKLCPQLSDEIYGDLALEQPEPYLAWAKEEEIRNSGSSGGVFGVLAKYFLENGGAVIGAAYRDDFSVAHIVVERVEELKRLNGSKYVQSNTKEIWKKVKNLLGRGKKVLFSGTPCQVDALYHFLGGSPSNLYTVDIICHGVPSPEVWRKYLLYLEKAWESKVQMVNFRKKDEFGWTQSKMSIAFEDGRTYLSSMEEDVYAKLFLQNVVLRESCYRCKYAKTERISDISLGDFWALRDAKLQGKEKGLSLILINKERGRGLLDKVNAELFLRSYFLEIASGHNSPLHHPPTESTQSRQFWEAYTQGGFAYAIQQFLVNTDATEQINCTLSVFRQFIRMETYCLNLSEVLRWLGISRIYLYGIGDIGKYLLKILKNKIEIVAIVDTQAESYQEGINGITVIHPKEISMNMVPILVSPASKYQEIFYNLVKLGVDQKRILSLEELLNYGMNYLQHGELPKKKWSYEKGDYYGM